MIRDGKNNLGFAAIIPVMFLVILTACTGNKQRNDPAPIALTVPVKVATIKSGDIQVTVAAYGQTEALQKDAIISPIGGKIIELPAREGQRIAIGDTLAIILTTESLTELEGAQTLVARAQTPEQKTEAQRALQLAEEIQNQVAIKSQIAGIITARNVAKGAIVAEGTDLFTILAPQSISFVAKVPLENLDGIAIGQPAAIEFTAQPNINYKASVIAINPQADNSNQSVRVLLRLTDITKLKSSPIKDGMAGIAHIITGEHKNVMIVPSAAVLRDDETNTYSVVTVTADSLSSTVPVNPGLIQDSTTEISSPDLREGMPVIIEGNYALPDSTHVTYSEQKAE
jgi:RND family efflux transporter MFP subunit